MIAKCGKQQMHVLHMRVPHVIPRCPRADNKPFQAIKQATICVRDTLVLSCSHDVGMDDYASYEAVAPLQVMLLTGWRRSKRNALRKMPTLGTREACKIGSRHQDRERWVIDVGKQ